MKTITAWAAGGAVALTAAFAFGAARGNHTAARAATPTRSQPQDTSPQDALPQAQIPDPQGSQGFQPPSSSSAPPAAMSGGS